MAWHIAVDQDDVVLDFWRGILHSWSVEFGESLPWVGPWDDCGVKGNPRLQEAGYKDWWAWMRDREWLWATFQAVPGAIAGIKTLRARGWYVECVTSKPAWAEHNVWKWLGKWRPPFNRVTIVGPGQSKLDFSSADVIVDDKLNTCMEWSDAGRRSILFDRRPALVPGFDEPIYAPDLLAASWDDVLSLAEGLEGGYV